jgi:4-hydroxyphenylacetate 3-monooxygenase
MKLYRLAWDLVGSEFAGRHLQYEKFYSGPGVVVRGHSLREAPWRRFDAAVERAFALQDASEHDSSALCSALQALGK